MSKHSIKTKKRVADIASMTAVIFLAALTMFPLWWILRSSLMDKIDIGTLKFIPTNWRFNNYIDAQKGFPYFKLLFNTAQIIVPTVLFGTITCVLCGYSFARLYFRGRKFVFGLCIASMLLPPMVTLIPLFVFWTKGLGLMGTYWPMIIPYLCGGGAFNIFLMRQFILTIPRELDEAAMIDGAGRLRILTQIIVPAIKPAIIVVALFIFLTNWNDVLQQNVYIVKPENFTIALGLKQFNGSYGIEWHHAMAATVLSIMPGVLIYLLGQRYFIEGIVMTGMKN